MIKEATVSTLKEESKKNPALSAVLHMFALRKRNRETITLRSLKYKMKEEGFDYPTSEYANVLSRLAALGMGKVESGRRGQVKGLKDISVSLRVLGNAVMQGEPEAIRTLGNNIKRLKQPKSPFGEPKISVNIDFNGKSINVPISGNISIGEIAKLITKF